MKLLKGTISLVLFFACGLAGAQTAAKPAGSSTAKPAAGASSTSAGRLPSQETVNSFMRHMFGYDPAISWRVASINPSPDPALAEVVVVLESQGRQNASRLYISPDGKYALQGELMPFGADPFARDRAILDKGVNGPAKGPASGVTVVEFADLQCPSCKNAAPIIDRLLGDEPNIHFIFQQYPLVQIHKWAYKAAEFATCVSKQNSAAVWKFAKDVYDKQEQITQAVIDGTNNLKDEAKLKSMLTDSANAAGVNGTVIAQCAELPSTAAAVDASMELGKKLDITGTPTVFIAGRRVQSVSQIPYDTLKALVEYQAKQPK